MKSLYFAEDWFWISICFGIVDIVCSMEFSANNNPSRKVWEGIFEDESLEIIVSKRGKLDEKEQKQETRVSLLSARFEGKFQKNVFSVGNKILAQKQNHG